ncbi:hypothetical protein ACVNIS_24915 (plasmid) [Sphaerotilaceae bacterium SBD11-9]
MTRKNKTPYFTYARFNSTCAETGAAIRKGDKVAYYPESHKVYANNSKQADELRSLEFSASYGMGDANY